MKRLVGLLGICLSLVFAGCESKEIQEMEKLVVSVPSTAICYVDEEVPLLVNGMPQKDFVYYVSDPSILEIDEQGIMHGLKEESVEVLASFDHNEYKSEVCTVNVLPTNPYMHGSYGSIQKTYFQEDYDVLSRNEGTQVDRVTLWRKDEGYSEYILTMQEDLDGLELRTSSFEDVDGNVLSATIQPEFISYTMASKTVGLANEDGVLTPDVIYGATIDAKKDTVLPIYNTIQTHEDALPGVYTGYVYVLKDGAVLKQFALEIEVLDLVQPSVKDESSFYLELWNYLMPISRYYEIEYMSDEYFEVLKNHLEPYVENGGKCVTACILEEPWAHQIHDDCPTLVKWTKQMDGSFVFDYNDFDTYASFVFENNIASRIACYSLVPIANMYSYYDEASASNVRVQVLAGSDEWKTMWSSFLQDFSNHLEEKGWYDAIYIAMDERSHDEMQQAIDLVHSIPNSKGQTLQLAGAFNRVIDDIWKQMDHACVNLHYALQYGEDNFKQLATKRREEGKLTTIYTCTMDRPNLYNMYHPSEAYWTILMCEKMGSDGYLRWAYDAWVEDPLADASFRTFETGDVQMIYPGGEDRIPRMSPRTCRLFEAIRDIEKLRYLRNEMGEEVDGLLASITNYYGQQDMDPLDVEMDAFKKQIMDLSKEYLAKKNS